MLIYTDLWTKNDFSKRSQKNVTFPNCWYLRSYEQKTTFLKWSQNNVIFLKIMKFADLDTKRFFQNDPKNVLFLDKLILRIYEQKTIFQNHSIKTWFTPKCWYLDNLRTKNFYFLLFKNDHNNARFLKMRIFYDVFGKKWSFQSDYK